jgi:drug/metabolite transporter (DMT)-like permease
MKSGLEDLTPYQVASIRIIFAGAAMLPIAFKAFKKTPRNLITPLIISGFLGSFFPAYFFCIAQTKIDSSLAGILNALTPIFTVAIGSLFFKLTLSWVKWSGLILGFLGMSILLLGGTAGINLTHLGFASFVILATICYGLNVNLINNFLKEAEPTSIAAIAFTSLIIPALAVLYGSGYFNDPKLIDGTYTQGTVSAAVLGIMGTGVASILFYMLVKKAGPVFASMVTYGIPFVAMGWGILSGEIITSIQAMGMAVILIGVRLANK